MTRPYDFESYRDYLKAKFRAMPQNGYGQLKKWADEIGVHPTLVSQILNGKKGLTTDQAILSAEFLGLNEMETEYFVGLVHLDRAGNKKAREFMRRQLDRLKISAADLNKRQTQETRLTEEQRSIFYSHWSYTAVRQAAAIDGYHNAEGIAEFLGIPLPHVRKCIQFLLATGLCMETERGIAIGPTKTFLEKASPWVKSHHAQWRQKSIQMLDQNSERDFNYTSPMTLSKSDAEKLRMLILEFIDNANSIVDASPSEALYCLNVDWFKVGK